MLSVRTTLLYAVLVALFLPATTVFADYNVMPLAINLDVAKRDIISETITLKNNSDRQVRLYASVHEVSVDGEGILDSFVDPSMTDRRTTAASWVQVTRSRIELAAGETKEIPIRIQLHPDTEPGKYSVFVGFAKASNQPQAISMVMRGDAPGTLINLSVDKEQNQFLRLARFVVDRFLTNSEDGTMSYTLSNPGTIDVVHGGEVIFYDTRGTEMTAVALNTEQGTIAPQETKEFSLTLPSELGWGKYKAFLSVEYGDNMTASVNDTAYFHVIPLWQILAAFVFLLLAAMLLTYMLYRRSVVDDSAHADALELYIQEGESEAQDHDINLKQPS